MKVDYGLMDEFLGSAIRDKRNEMGLSLTDVAVEIGISKSRLSNYEQAIRSMPLDIYVKVCDVLHINAEKLYIEAQTYMRKKIFK